MTNRAEMLPDRSIVDQFTDEVLRPKLVEISKELSRRFELDMAVIQGDTVVLRLDRLSVGSEKQDPLHGECRLRFREAFGNRILIFCEVLFDRNEAVHNCSGFSLRGDWKAETAIKRTGYTVRYSVWEWTGWR